MAGLSTNAPGLWGGFAGLLYGSTSLSTPPGFLADATPAWVLPGAALDLDFADSLGYNSRNLATTTPDSILTYANPSAKMVYGSDGVLRYAPHNLLLQSQTFNTTWSLGSNSVTDNQDVAPDGTTTADLVTMVVASGVFQTIAVTASTTYTFSFWAKRGTKTNLQYRVYNNTGAANITAPTSYYSSTSAGAFSRITHTFTTPAGCISLRVYIDDSNDGTSGTFLVWGAQLNNGSSALTYIPTTTAAVYSLPIDHNPTTFAPLGVLIEEQRTNLLLQSQTFNTTWATTQASISSNTTVSPDGTTTADTFLDQSSGTYAEVRQSSISFTSGTTYTYSIFLKQGTRRYAYMAFPDGQFPNNSLAIFDLQDGIVKSVGAGAPTARIQDCGNGWYRCSISATADASSTGVVYLYHTNDLGTDIFYTGSGSGSMYVWGAQLEAGAFATSYIPTTNNPLGVTRLADQVSILTSAFGYNAAAGTMVATYRDVGQNAGAWRIDDNSENSYFRLIRDTGNIVFDIVRAAGLEAQFYRTPATEIKHAAAWTANSANVALNGSLATEDTTVTVPTGMLTFRIGQNRNSVWYNGHIKRLTYFPTRRSNADLQVLST